MNYEKCKVVMLPTKVKAPNFSQGYIVKCTKSWTPSGEPEVPVGKLSVSVNTSEGVLSRHQPQHIYILSDRPITGKGFRMDLDRMTVGLIDSDHYYNNSENGNFKLIIATTDEFLGLPRPSKAFIKKFCDLGGIEDVLVECNQISEEEARCNGFYATRIIKVASDNTITILSADLLTETLLTPKEIKQLLWQAFTEQIAEAPPEVIEEMLLEPFNGWIAYHAPFLL